MDDATFLHEGLNEMNAATIGDHRHDRLPDGSCSICGRTDGGHAPGPEIANAKQGDRHDAIARLQDEIERLHAEKDEAQRQEHMAKSAEMAGQDLAEAVGAYIAATVPSVSDEWTKLGEALADYRQKSRS